MSILSPYLVVLESKTIKDVKLIRFILSFFGIVISPISFESKVAKPSFKVISHRNGKLLWFLPLFFGKVHSLTSIESKVKK